MNPITAVLWAIHTWLNVRENDKHTDKDDAEIFLDRALGMVEFLKDNELKGVLIDRLHVLIDRYRAILKS